MWGELSSEWGELSSHCRASRLWDELSWGELSLGRVVRNPYKILKLDADKWTKFEFIHYYPGKFSLFLIFYWTIWGCY